MRRQSALVVGSSGRTCKRDAAVRVVPLLLFTLWWLTAWADILEGRVVAIADGDTLTLLDANRQQHRIRLGGIDAPEKGQPYGTRSRMNLSNLAFGKDARAGKFA